MNQSDRSAITKCIQNAQSAINICNSRQAEKYLLEAVERVEKIDPGLHTLVLYTLATFYCTEQDYSEAERLYKKSIPILEILFFPFHYYLAELYTDIGVTCLAAKRYDDAEKYFTEALERLNKPDSMEELNSMTDRIFLELGKLHFAQQNFDKAEACVKRPILNAEQNLLQHGTSLEGLFQCSLATRQHELVKIYLAQKKYKEAEALCKQVLDVREKRREYVQSPILADTLFTLADIFSETEREPEAKVLRKRANDLMETSFEPERSYFEIELTRSFDTCLRALQDDASAAQMIDAQVATQARRDFTMKRYMQAEQCYRRMLKNREELVGPHHLDLLKDLDILLMLSLKQKKYAEAEATCLRQLQIAEMQLGKNNFVVADKLKWLAAIKTCQNDFAGAEPYFARSFAITEDLLIPDSWIFAHLLTTFAELREVQGKGNEADVLNQTAYRIFSKGEFADQRYFPGAHYHIAGASYFSLAAILDWTGNSEGALTLLIKTLNSREESLGATDPNVGTAACRLAEHHWQTEHFSEAEALYLKALRIFEASPEKHPADTFCCNSSLAYLLRAMKRYEEANEYEAKNKAAQNT
jgi:tetratricopeptide (TPR) repeat protein